jgi:hypothetical protein
MNSIDAGYEFADLVVIYERKKEGFIEVTCSVSIKMDES